MRDIKHSMADSEAEEINYFKIWNKINDIVHELIRITPNSLEEYADIAMDKSNELFNLGNSHRQAAVDAHPSTARGYQLGYEAGRRELLDELERELPNMYPEVGVTQNQIDYARGANSVIAEVKQLLANKRKTNNA